MTFGGKPVLVVERFDRLWHDGILYRLPQENLCQALAISPTKKYQKDGGPSIKSIMTLLNGSMDLAHDRSMYIRAQLVFWLLAAVDGHAKNFSLLLGSSGYQLAPIYDVISIAPYPQYSLHKVKMAMAVGEKNYYQLKQIQLRHFYQTAQWVGLPISELNNIIEDLLNKMDDAINIASKMRAPAAILEPIIQHLKQQGKIFVNKLG